MPGRFGRWLFSLAFLTPCVVPDAAAQDNAVYIVTYIEVAPGTEAPSATALKQYHNASAKDAGLVRMDVVQRTAPAHQYAIVSIWSDQKAFEAHRDGAAVRQFAAAIQPHLIAPFDIRVHNTFAVAPAVAAPTGSGPVFIITHVDVPPPLKDKCVDALHELVAASRKESGVARFEVFQQTSRPNHFTVVEVWKGETEYHAHLVAAHTKRFRDVLTPMTGALYDERRHRGM